VFDWEVFLGSHGIETTTGSRYHITRHHIGINCPFCGDDTGYNMGIDVRNGFWHCWREPSPGSHSGRSPYRLIEALLGCARDTARLIVQAGESAIVANDRTYHSDINRRLGIGVSTVTHTVTTLEFPDEYQRLDSSPRARKLYYPYLIGRGYSERQVDWLVKRFGLRYAVRGVFSYRVIVPVYHNGRLVTWTGRHIGNDELRYRSLSSDPDKALQLGQPQAVENIKHTLLDFDAASYGGRTLVITEGPFDAIRVSFFGHRYAINAVALYGKQATPEQLDLLADLIPRYKEVVTLLDADAASVFGPLPELLNIKQYGMPNGIKDPALLTRELFGHMFGVGDK
jgi:hypothetical protein